MLTLLHLFRIGGQNSADIVVNILIKVRSHLGTLALKTEDFSEKNLGVSFFTKILVSRARVPK